jgi:hypothetical protein
MCLIRYEATKALLPRFTKLARQQIIDIQITLLGPFTDSTNACLRVKPEGRPNVHLFTDTYLYPGIVSLPRTIQ